VSSYSPSEIERVKQQNPISSLIGKVVTFDKKKSIPGKGDWWGCCPFHGEKSPSFHCVDPEHRYHCFGCGVSGDQIKFLMEFNGISFSDALKELGGNPEVMPNPKREAEMRKEQEQRRLQAEREREQTDDDRANRAAEIFKSGQSIKGTLAEKYLLGRKVPPQSFSPLRLRFIPDLDLEIEPKGKHPALVTAVTNNAGQIRAIWRIYLDEDGKALLTPEGRKIKRGLGPAGGCAVRLSSEKTPIIAVTEGLETAYGVKALTQDRYCVWAALSTSGMIGLDIPDHVREVRIYADGDMNRFNPTNDELMDPPGLKAAKSLAEKCRERNITTTIEVPPMGSDWLDVWQQVSEYV